VTGKGGAFGPVSRGSSLRRRKERSRTTGTKTAKDIFNPSHPREKGGKGKPHEGKKERDGDNATIRWETSRSPKGARCSYQVRELSPPGEKGKKEILGEAVCLHQEKGAPVQRKTRKGSRGEGSAISMEVCILTLGHLSKGRKERGKTLTWAIACGFAEKC